MILRENALEAVRVKVDEVNEDFYTDKDGISIRIFFSLRRVYEFPSS
jgi:hypothetical protein